MIINGVEIIGRIKPIAVFRSPALENILNNGTIVATCGTIIASSKIENSLSFPLSWYTSNPYPAIEQISRQITVVRIA